MKSIAYVLSIVIAILTTQTFSYGQLSDKEVAAIEFAIQEEKVAHNFYAEMLELYGLRCFKNISQSELTHMALVTDLIDRYGIENPVSGKFAEPGMFQDASLSNIFNDLITAGKISSSEALKEAAKFEELDIVNLRSLREQTEREDIRNTFSILESASYNHLRAFVRNLNSMGSEYTPTYISREEYDQIISGSGKGNRSRCRSNN